MRKVRGLSSQGSACPVLNSYFLHAKRRFDSDRFVALFGSVKEELEELEEGARNVPSSRAVQLLRSFYCLEVAGGVLDKGGLIENIKKERTYEGLTEAIEEAAMVQRGLKVRIATRVLKGPGTIHASEKWRLDMIKQRTKSMEDAVALAARFEEAARYLRPRLRNTESLAGMGRFAVEALYAARASGDVYISCARDLVNITETNGIRG